MRLPINFFKLILLVWFIEGPLMATAQKVTSVQTDSLQHINLNSRNSAEQQKKPYVILISADGFRYDYAKKYQASHLLELSAGGVQAKSMIPSFPSLTFSNHYTLVTGLYPAHHGLVNNSFYDEKRDDKYSMSAKDKVTDGSWYGGTPLWVLAEKQQMLAASLFWVGSEADIQGIRPSYYYSYTEKLSAEQRVKIVKDWLLLPEDRRPHLITFYLSEPDHSGHSFGPDAPETAKAVHLVDSTVYMLTEAVKSTGLPVNFIFVSDHGMTKVDREHPLALPKEIDLQKFVMPASGTMVDLHAKNKADIAPLYKALKKSKKDYKVYLKANMPSRDHYRTSDDRMNHIGDILLIPTWPRVFSQRTPGIGHHGFDPRKVKDMQATFFAWGPAIKSNLHIGSFENVNVYPLITEILDLPFTEAIDGRKQVLHKILK
jgi:predicted AlkP superfamily pyrophosphatase or phosphodiesterase